MVLDQVSHYHEFDEFAQPSRPVTQAARETWRRHDQISGTNIPGISLHRWHFRALARYQRPRFCIRLARCDRVHRGLMYDSVFLRHSLSVL